MISLESHFEPTDRYLFGGPELADQLAADESPGWLHRIRGTRAVFGRAPGGLAVWGQQGIDSGWLDAGVVRDFAWARSQSELDQEIAQIIDESAAASVRERADLEHMIDGIYRDTVDAIKEAPGVVGDAAGAALNAAGEAAGRAFSASPLGSVVLVAALVGAVLVATR